MQKESSYELLQTKRWRAITYDWNILSGYGDTSRLYCLTDFQAGWLLSNMDYMAWQSRWSNCPCTDEDLAHMKAQLEYNLMTCIDVQPYQIQSLYDALQTAQLAEYQALWDAGGNPSDVNPSAPDDYYNGDDSDDRNTALCTACKIYVYSYASNWVALATVILALAVITVLPALIALVGGVIANYIFGGLTFMALDYYNAMQDTDALDMIACCMADTLTGLAITSANFETCLDSCDFLSGSNSELSRQVIASDLDKFVNWLTFINALGNAYDLAQIGVSDCAVCNFTVSRLGGNGNANMAVLQWGGTPPYDTPIGYYDAPSDSYISGQSSGQDYGLLNVTFTFSAPKDITKIVISSSLAVTRDFAGSQFEMLADGVQIYVEALAYNPTPHVYGVTYTTPVNATVLQFKWAIGGSSSLNGNAQFKPLYIEYD